MSQPPGSQHQRGLPIRESSHGPGSSSYLTQDTFQRIIRSQTSPVLTRKQVVVQRLFDPLAHQLSRIRQLHLLQLRYHLLGLLPPRHAVFLRVDGLQHRRYFLHLARGYRRPYVAIKMHRAALPQRFRVKLSQALHQPRHLSETNSRTPASPRSFKCRRKAVQLAWSSLAPSATASTSRKPSAFTPIATSSDTFRTSPPQLRFSHSPSRNTYG